MSFFTDDTQAFIFDVDGTLYDQIKLRRMMFGALVRHLVRNKNFIRDIHILYSFRKRREILSRDENDPGCLENRQYVEVAHKLGVSVDEVRRVVTNWIFEKPLNYLAACIYPGVKDLFSLLMRNKLKIGIFSYYPSLAKLKALELYADVVICATDENVDRFKPHPKGLLVTAKELGIPVKSCFFIGDRDDKDGECARRAGMPYLILSRKDIVGGDGYRKMTIDLIEKNKGRFH